MIQLGSMLLVLAVVLALAQSNGVAAPHTPWSKIVIGRQTEPEKLATVDLQRYIAQVTGTVPTIVDSAKWQKQPGQAVILGSPKTNPLLVNALPKTALAEQGFFLANKKLKGAQVVIAAGSTPVGATNAVYGLLRELGYGFYLGSEAIPDTLPDALPKSPITRQPVFTMRGVLPWYNFFNSPTTWDPIDHRAFVDQLVRLGANFVGFHTYDAEPFGGFMDNGKMRLGARLLNTGSPTWGSTGVRTRDFAFGTDKLYNREFFGADSTMDIRDAIRAIQAEQDIIRDALDYAKRRGLNACIGFEISSDPMMPEERETFLKRLNHLVDQYPAADYIWLWQPETQGAQGYAKKYSQHMLPNTLQPDSPLPRYGIAREDVFQRIVGEAAGESPFYRNTEDGRRARANEGARLEQYAQLALHALEHRKNAPKLVISGWGGDQRLLSAEYYDGLDKLLPKDVAFASLDHIGPRTRVDRIYGELPPDRQRWPIPWLENDGDQWHPQPYVHIYEKMAQDAHKGGSQGILGIHWRTRDIEENFGYLMQYSWDPTLTADKFFKDYASRCYDSRIAADMAKMHTDLDILGYRWVGGAGQVECGGFGWGPGEEGKAKQLEAIKAKAISLLPQAGKGEARLQWLIDEMEWVLRFREAELAAVKADGLLAKATNASPEEAKKLGQEALASLDGGEMEKALRAFGERLSTRGEYGVLATINTKAVAAWRGLRERSLKLAGVSEPESRPWNPEARIMLPRLVASTKAGSALTLEPIVFGGGKAWLHYRQLGQAKWTTAEMKSSSDNWVQTVEIPASAVKSPGMEIAFSFSQNPGNAPAFGPVAVTVMPGPKSATLERAVVAAGKNAIRLKSKEGTAFALEVSWNDIPDADYYRVYRDGKFLIETAVAMLPDTPAEAEAIYSVDAMRDGKIIAQSGQTKFAVPVREVTEQLRVDVKTTGTGVSLHWPAAASPMIESYRVTRASADSPSKQTDMGEISASRKFEHAYWDSPSSGKWVYSVIPIDTGGRPGKPTVVTVEFTRQATGKPVFDAPLTSRPEGSNVVGSVAFDESGATFEGGYIMVPHKDWMNLGTGMTLAFDFKASDAGGMPVLISHGTHMGDGWFVQILSGKLLMRTPGGDVWGPEIQTNRWYSAQFVFDGSHCHVEIDGKRVGTTMLQDNPATRSLIIGQYESKEPTYAFHGTVRNVRIYPEALSSD